MSYGSTHGRHEKPAAKTEYREERTAVRERPAPPPEKPERYAAAQQSRERKPARERTEDAPNVGRTLRNVLITVILVAAVSVLLASFKMPVIRVYGDAMVPLLGDRDIIAGIKDVSIEPGDIVGVYYGNKLLTKRCIAVAGQKVDTDEAGNVFVDGNILDEPYAVNKAALAETTDIETPFTVPKDHIFVLGDNRSNPADSRSVDVGCFQLEDVCGRLVFRIWPLPMKVLK